MHLRIQPQKKETFEKKPEKSAHTLSERACGTHSQLTNRLSHGRFSVEISGRRPTPPGGRAQMMPKKRSIAAFSSAFRAGPSDP